jgi:hypothetical protein
MDSSKRSRRFLGARTVKEAGGHHGAAPEVRPSTQPPETLPEISPRSLNAIWVPSGRGAERTAPTTMAIAMRSPRSANA